MLTRKESFESIKKRLEYLQLSISNSGSLNQNDLAIHAENFFRDLLNLVYGWNLANANTGNQNAADIDLIDKEAKLAIQVTARNDRAKIADTIDSFHSKEENSGFKLKFMLISKEAGNYREFKGLGDSFDPSEDIIDIKRLLREINDFDTPKIVKLSEFLESEIVFPEGQKADFQKFFPHYFIPDLKYFVGREDFFANLNNTLAAHHKASIHDISGLGKTFACYKYASDNQEQYSKIFFVNAAKEAWMESLARLGQMLHPGIEDAPQEAQAMAFKNWLENNDGWLAIYDNVDEPALLKRFIPINTQGDCLFTSNDPEIKNLGPVVSISKLEDKNAALLLYSRSNAEVSNAISFSKYEEETAFWQIVSDIDGLPVSLNTTAACIDHRGIGYAEYLEALEAEPHLELENEDNFDPYGKSALRAFTLAMDTNTSLASQSEEGKLITGAVKELYCAASLIAPDDIHEEFLRAYLEANYQPFADAEKQNVLWTKIRKKFREFDLFKYGAKSESFSTHRLIQKCIFSRLSDADKKSYSEKILEALEAFFPEYDYTNKEQCERYYQHTLAALGNASRIGLELGIAVVLYRWLARYQELLGNYQQAETFYKRSLETSRKVCGEKAAETAIALNNLARIFDVKGDYDNAIACFQKAQEIAEETIGKEHPDYATRLNNLAVVYANQGKYDEAIELFTQSKEIRRKVLGEDHQDYAQSLNNLGGVYCQLGNYDEAIRLHEQAKRIREEVFGRAHPDYSQSLNELAVNYQGKGRYDEALDLYKESLAITEIAAGKEHPEYAIRLSNLAWVYLYQKKYSEALPLFEEALRIREIKLPPEHPSIADTRETIEYCKSKMGNA